MYLFGPLQYRFGHIDIGLTLIMSLHLYLGPALGFFSHIFDT